MTELNITSANAPAESHNCTCGGHDEALPELDARQIPHAIRHASVLGVVDNLQQGSAFVLVAPHDPQPLLAQIVHRHGDDVELTYVQRGPEAWKIKVERV